MAEQNLAVPHSKWNHAHKLSIRSLELGEFLQNLDLTGSDARYMVNEAVSALLDRQVSLLAELCDLLGDFEEEAEARYMVNEAVSALLDRQVSLLAELCDLLGDFEEEAEAAA